MKLRLGGSVLKARWFLVDESKRLRPIADVVDADENGEYLIEMTGPMVFVTMRTRPGTAPMFKIRIGSPTRGLTMVGDYTPSEFEDYIETNGIDIGNLDLILPRMTEAAANVQRREHNIAHGLLLSMPPAIPPPPKEKIHNQAAEMKRRFVASRAAAKQL